MAALGTSGLSLALGVYNTSQITALKETISTIMEKDGKVMETIEEEQIQPTPFVPSESSEVNELQEKMSKLEIFANTTSTRASSNSRNLVIANDEVDRLTTFTTEEMVDVRQRLAETENSTSSNTSNIEILETTTKDTNTSVTEANNRIDDAVKMATDIDSGLSTAVLRLDTAEQNAIQISSNLNTLALDTDELGDKIDLVDKNGVDTKTSLENLYTAWNTLGSKVYVADNKFNAAHLNATDAKISLNNNHGDLSAIHFAGPSNSQWAMYLSNTIGKAPNGKAPLASGGVTGHALRIRLDEDSKNGLIVEDGVGKGLVSITSKGVTDIKSGRIADINTGVTAYANTKMHNKNSFAVAQDTAGNTRVNCAAGKALALSVDGQDLVTIRGGNKTVTINNMDGTNNTHFNYLGDNFIRTAPGKATNFSWGKGSTSVAIVENEVNIAGTNVKQTIEELSGMVKSLQAKVAALEKNTIVHGETVILKNQNNKKLLRKASSNNDALVDTTSIDSRSKFWIDKA